MILIERAKLIGAELERVKCTSRARNAMALDEAVGQGAWDALLGTEEGDFPEGSRSNLFIVRAGEVLTPPLERGCLPGIVRGKVIEIARAAGIPLRESRIDRRDLAEADEVFVTSSLGGVRAVTGLQGLREDLPPGGGELTRQLRERFRALERACRGHASGKG